MILTETKITDAVYCHNRLGYDVVLSQATVTMDGGYRGGGGVILVLQERLEGWIFEST